LLAAAAVGKHGPKEVGAYFAICGQIDDSQLIPSGGWPCIGNIEADDDLPARPQRNLRAQS
jgi:hypothetical protein